MINAKLYFFLITETSIYKIMTRTQVGCSS
jgi:hypothetical protein